MILMHTHFEPLACTKEEHEITSNNSETVLAMNSSPTLSSSILITALRADTVLSLF